MTKAYTIRETVSGKVVFSFTVNIPNNQYTNLKWDSRTGLVTALYQGKRVPLETSGNTFGTLNPVAFTAENITSMDYNYWYY